MRLCLTGDVHHRSLGTREAPIIAPATELDLAERYVDIAQAFGVRSTLFITADVAKEQPDKLRTIAANLAVEIGGHGSRCFKPGWYHAMLRGFTGSYHGTRAMQLADVQRALEALGPIVGKVSSWRNHSRIFDQNTQSVLAEAGIKIWSDVRADTTSAPWRTEYGLVILPINTSIDHGRVDHGAICASRGFPVIPVDRWVHEVLRAAESADRSGTPVFTVLAHPVCMYLADKFKAFRKLCQELASFESVLARDVAEYV